MATIKIIKEESECFESIEENLIKALQSKSDDSLFTKRFDDPLMNKLLKQLDEVFLDLYPKMIQEILDILK